MVDVKYEEQGQLQLLDRDDSDEEKDGLEAIERLIAQGINVGDIKKLEDAGIYTCNEFTMHVKKILTGMEGLSEAKVEKTCEATETIVHLRDFRLKVAPSLIRLANSSDVQITTGWQTLDELHGVIAQGINAGDIKKLKDAGIYTCNGCMMHLKKILTGIEGLSEAKVEKICETAEKIVLGYITGSDVLVKPYLLRPVNSNSSDVPITTGWQTLAELLGRGIQTFSITEAFGEFRSGKPQLAHTLCVSTQLSVYMDGGKEKIAYIDTEGTFRPDPIFTIAERFGMDVSAILTHGTVGGLVGDAMIPIFGPNLHLFNLGAEILMGLPGWGFVFFLGTFAAVEFEGDIGAGFAIGLFPGLDMHQVPVPVPQEIPYLIALLTGLIRLIEYAIAVEQFPLSILTPEEEIGNSLLGGPDLPNEDAAGLLNQARNLLHGTNWTVKVGAFPIQHVCAEQAAIDAWPQ